MILTFFGEICGCKKAEFVNFLDEYLCIGSILECSEYLSASLKNTANIRMELFTAMKKFQGGGVAQW